MIANVKELIRDLVHTDEQVFERANVAIANRPQAGSNDDIEFFGTVLSALSECDTIGPIECERRAALSLRHAPLTLEFASAIGQQAKQWSPVVKNAVTRFLPASMRQAVYRLRSPGQDRSTALATKAPVPIADVPGPNDEGRPVIILGTAQEQDSNIRRLERIGYRPFRAASYTEFRTLLQPDICGVVIGASWWALLPDAEHIDFIQTLVNYSSVVWLKIDTSGCQDDAALGQLCGRARFREPKQRELSLSASSAMTDGDFDALRRAAALLGNEADVRLVPAELDPSQARLLVAGVTDIVDDRHFPATVRVDEIKTLTIHGGQSEALIVKVQPNVGGLPLIGKFDDLGRLREEMGRFSRYIKPSDPNLNPVLYFHGEVGLILFGLVGTPDEPARPAPTLEETIGLRLLVEVGAQGIGVPTTDDLLLLIERTVAKIRSLNSHRCADISLPSRAWIGTQNIDTMIGKGITWHVSSMANGRDPLELRAEAVELVQSVSCAATIHGDVHLRNVLVRDGREPYLIDYANAGPGHPCFDLVRLECALLFQVFRLTDDERAVRDLLLAADQNGITVGDLSAKFPRLCQSFGNQATLGAILAVRSACHSLLRDYGADLVQYYAMRLVVACQSLAIPNQQIGVVRASISAFGELFFTHIK